MPHSEGGKCQLPKLFENFTVLQYFLYAGLDPLISLGKVALTWTVTSSSCRTEFSSHTCTQGFSLLRAS